MIQVHSITENIVIQPSQLKHIKSAIRQHIESKVGTCSKQYGYIERIIKIDYDSMTNFISRTSGCCVFQVSFEMECNIPQVGDIIDGIVMMIFTEGILLRSGRIQIIIPNDKTRVLEKGSTHKVVITSVRYDHFEYQCVGKLNLVKSI